MHKESTKRASSQSTPENGEHPLAARKPTLAEEASKRKPSETIFFVFLLCCIAVMFWQTTKSRPEPTEPLLESINITKAKEERFTPSDFLVAFGQRVVSDFPDSSSDAINENLLIKASEAVANEDQSSLADSLAALGVTALGEGDEGAAGLYLDEALSIFEEIQNDMGIAQVELLRGELNIMKRANARRAGYAYDATQVARWKVARGQFHDAIEELEFAVKENLDLNRYGAAAAVYQTLYKGYVNHGQLIDAQQAGMEIVRLHASSGRPLKAGAMLETLQSNGLDAESVTQLQSEINLLQLEYEHSVGQIGQARDYQQLYNHFIHAGDPVQAWQFRVRAQQSLNGASQRAMHRSQTGVLALLYTSNEHIDNAEKSLERARQLFSDNNESDLVDMSERLQEQSY